MKRNLSPLLRFIIALLPAFALHIPASGYTLESIVDPNRLSNSCVSSLYEGQLVIGGFSNGTTPIDFTGYSGVTTVSGHAYTFMHPSNPAAMFVMRNPWGGHNGNIPGSADGQINIPDNNVVPPVIDLRIVEPGKAANYGGGVFAPYTPPVFTRAEMVMRLSPELMRNYSL